MVLPGHVAWLIRGPSFFSLFPNLAQKYLAYTSGTDDGGCAVGFEMIEPGLGQFEITERGF